MRGLARWVTAVARLEHPGCARQGLLLVGDGMGRVWPSLLTSLIVANVVRPIAAGAPLPR